jgi:hypothetical protein
MPDPCATIACPNYAAPGCCGLCLSCWLKLPQEVRARKLAAVEVAEYRDRWSGTVPGGFTIKESEVRDG